MNNKTAFGIIIAIVIIIAGAVYMMSRPRDNSELNQNQVNNYGTADKVEGRGRVVFSVTDAAADMDAISEINMKVNSVEAHSATDGWVNVSSVPRTYSLLDLKARSESELLADANLKPGMYDQIRLQVDSIAVETKAGATKIAKLPSGELKINAKLVVAEGETSSVNFDFLADKSLHMTGEGVYIFAPVVKTETRSGSVIAIDGKSVVSIQGGTVDDARTVGMGIDGSVKADFELKSNQKLDIGTDNKIKISL